MRRGGTTKKNHHKRSGEIVMSLFLVAAACSMFPAILSVDAWMVGHPHPIVSTWSRTRTSTSSSSTLLEAQRKNKGSLGSLAKEGLIDKSSASKPRPRRQTTTTSTKKSGTSKASGARATAAADGSDAAIISPALAEWMKSQEESTTGNISGGAEVAAAAASQVSPMSASSSSAVTFEAFGEEDDVADYLSSSSNKNKKKGKDSNVRRVKQSQRNQQEEERQAQMDVAVTALEEALDGTKKNNLDEILNAVQGLLALPSSPAAKDNPRLLLGGKRRYNYRLAWAGSDDAICHVGTGLHKVPLARLQEVFWSCLGKNRVELLEVIRILGPFPNVRNTLQGNVKLLKSSNNNNNKSALDDDASVTTMNIVMDSMVDGTGKEIMAGKEENVRRVNLELYFADERAMVAVVPPEDGSRRANPLENKGFNVLVFLQEEDLDEKLDSLRVS
mmetsp:Transcript_126189/g.353364  ORF Transcript_126189/g.353364 Transcript_126189/m.353364 type:complete len:445 (-) Transcript_126189:10-1344(-)